MAMILYKKKAWKPYSLEIALEWGNYECNSVQVYLLCLQGGQYDKVFNDLSSK